MKRYILGIMALLSLVACQPSKPSDKSEQAEKKDKIAEAGVSKSLGQDVSGPSDGLFDDFIYSFMNNRSFQYKRIDFPLSNVVDGVDYPIVEKKWKYDRLYSQKDVYTLIFDDEASIKAEKDTSLSHVIVEWVYLDKGRVKQYIFDKKKGLWRLTGLNTHSLEDNVNSDFYKFYARFSSDVKYQEQHVMDPFNFKTYDSDNSQYIEGLLGQYQWQDYRPELPAEIITNINYGQSYKYSDRRVLLICSPSGGMGCSLTFIRKGKNWFLDKLEN